MLIQPKYLKLSDLLNGRLFRIPPYQRAYSWERKQREDLFADIEGLKGGDPEASHFMATMVGLERGKTTIVTDELQEIEVVDGQQRLTTLIILIKALALALDRHDKKERAFAEELDSLLVKDDSLSLLLLQTNHDLSNYFQNYLRNGTHPDASDGKTIADRLLLEAMADCEEFVASWSDRLLLGAILKNRLTFIFHEIRDELAVYTVFEVLNSRGLDVAWLDRLKSILMGMAFETGQGNKKETVAELHRIWGDVYRCVGLHQGRSNQALRFAATLRNKETLSKPLGEEDAVESLRAMARRSAKGAVEVSQWVLAVVQAVDKLMADNRRQAVTKIAHARLLAVAIELREDLGKGREKLLDQWEKVTFRIFGMFRRDARTGVGDYVRLARRLLAEQPTQGAALAAIRDLCGEEFEIGAAVDELRNANCYEGWEEELRYFMFKYEEHLAKTIGQKFDNAQWARIWQASPVQSIEHIFPQSRGSLVHTNSKKQIFVHRLGNLTLLPPKLNSKLSAKLPGDKAADYEATGLLVAATLKGDLKNWSVSSVDERENELLEWAKVEWGG
jgi:hypothetical protein